jgi:serine/threonine protein kinase
MATVYLARDIKHDRHVALKVLDPELGSVLGGERFPSEIRVTAHLQHPDLLPLFDSGDADGMLFYVMPFVAGESLRAKLEREQQLTRRGSNPYRGGGRERRGLRPPARRGAPRSHHRLVRGATRASQVGAQKVTAPEGRMR